MTLPGFSAENSIGGTIPYQLARSPSKAVGIQPQGVTLRIGRRCAPRFEWVWAVCNVIDGVPIYCQKLEYLGIECS
jgi:hypothetical protein